MLAPIIRHKDVMGAVRGDTHIMAPEDRALVAVAPHPDVRTITLDEFRFSTGEIVAPMTLAYETWGTLAATRDNAVLICHALTGDSHARDLAHPDDPRAGWWNPLIGPGRVFDTTRYFVICANVPGGC